MPPSATSRIRSLPSWLKHKLRRTLKSFEKIVSRGEIPKTYLTERGILFSLKELDEWLMRKTLPQDT